jgi:hypothetical protein
MTDLSGGGIHLYNSNPTLSHVTITGNTVLTNGNEIVEGGGGMILFNSNPTLIHVIVSGNMANLGGGIYLANSNPTLVNSIIWDNHSESIFISSIFGGTSDPIITYSNIEGGFDGVGNIQETPLFNNPESGWTPNLCVGDNYLCNGLNLDDCLMLISAGLCDEFQYIGLGDYTLQVDSPCIDSGTSYFELDEEVIINLDPLEYCGEAPDMGAYEYCEEECGVELADVNGDSQINILDLVQISYYILELSTPAYECAADYNQDGEVNILDLVQIVNYILDN